VYGKLATSSIGKSLMSRKTVLVATISIACFIGTGALGAGTKAPKKLTCCEEAAAKDKECSHKCCVLAHNKKESCVKCNPGKEDLKAAKDAKARKNLGSQTAAR
jgi:hypothetical protein